VFRSRNAPSARQTRGPSGDSPAPVKTQPAEDVFLATICRDDQALAYALNNLDLSYITHPLAHEIIEKMYRHYRNGDWHGIEMFINSVSDEEASLITTVLTSVPPVDDNALTILEDCIKSLHVHAYTIEIQQLKDELRLVSDPAGIQDIQGRIRSYQMLKRDQNKIKKLTV